MWYVINNSYEVNILTHETSLVFLDESEICIKGKYQKCYFVLICRWDTDDCCNFNLLSCLIIKYT